ncbi:MAG: hypothetical protein II723_04970 [Oscillospiraceae bacterium]|nr:hypothetical protein [Oscillospiraceae bacterium]
MKYKIVYDRPGRIRFRCGAYAFDREHEAFLYSLFTGLEAVTSAEIHSENGSILICYRAGQRRTVIDAAAGIGKETLQVVDLPEYAVQQIDSEYWSKIRRTVLKRLFRITLLPAPVRHFLSAMRGLRYVARGIYSLLGGDLTVDVLDGASISACLLQRNYKTAGTVMFLLNLSSILEDYSRAAGTDRRKIRRLFGCVSRNRRASGGRALHQ